MHLRPTNDEERFRTQTLSQIQLNARVNTFIKGSMRSEPISDENFLLGTSTGDIIELSKVDKPLF